MTAKLIWITPDADNMVGYLARISNVNARPTDPSEKLIGYLLEHKHFSPFEMVSACVEIQTTRDVARQILRHRSFHFQEFSQRYAEVDQAQPSFREARLQDPKNRQNSLSLASQLSLDDEDSVNFMWNKFQNEVWHESFGRYREAISLGIAKEQARALLPEGLTETRMYASGTIRDWLHYLEVRLGPETQREHQLVAQTIHSVLAGACPTIFGAAKKAGFNFGASSTGQD